MAGAREHDGADAAAGNGDAVGPADCGRAADLGADAEFGRRDGHDGNLHALTFAKFSRSAGICWRTWRLHPSFRSRRSSGYVRTADQHRAGKRRTIFSGVSACWIRRSSAPHHTYGYPDSGTTESVKAISRDDLEKFWKQNYFSR